MRRVCLRLEYDGTDFAGWQLQPGARTVQGALEEALEEITGEQRRFVPAGRTDSGVHARGQVAHVDLASALAPPALERGLNAVLPADVAVLELRDVSERFHARHDARSKTYVYRILNRPMPSPLNARFTWHLRSALDVRAMTQGASLVLGTHDFSAFRGAPGGPPEDENPRRSLDRLDVLRHDDEVWIVAAGRSFLRHMVRNLVGTLVEIGQCRRPPDDMAKVLASRDRANAGPTAPAHGLCLERVLYDLDRT